MQSVLEKKGFKVEYLTVESGKNPFKNIAHAKRLLGDKRTKKWQENGRLEALQKYIEGRGRTLTKSILVGKARK